ncbi:hypothetical protein BFINE_31650 [Bacteroides finegoldii DSM 17565]|jgi:hypothetical protein|nr:hypothetical protein BFINE_31650 [Bacteroides finegoldii DSM 17565]
MAQTPDTLYVFRFVSHKNMFYIPWKGNGTQLDHLLSLVENHKAAILSGEVPLLVDGYCVSEPTVAENLKLAKIRSNRVKSELILSKGIDENCFITRNHAETYGDLCHVVIVRLRLPQNGTAANVKEDSVISIIKEKVMEVISENSEQEACPGTTSVGVSSEKPLASSETHPSYRLALRANPLRWATLTPRTGC